MTGDLASRSTSNDSYRTARATLLKNESSATLPTAALRQSPPSSPRSSSARPVRWLGLRRSIWLTLLGLFIAAAIAGVVLGIVLSNREASSSPSQASDSDSSSNSNTTVTHATVATGNDGDWLKLSDDTVVQFRSEVGGTFDTTAFSNTARASDDSPPLNQSFDYNKDPIRGVNIGGWLSLEPFITPSIFQRFENASVPAVDEWTLCENLDAISSTEKKTVYEQHYSTFITESDFAAIAAAGLNWVRISVPFWAIESYSDEPFYVRSGTSAAEQTDRSMAILPQGCRLGSSLWNHSGMLGGIGLLETSMGLANAQRYLSILRSIVQFISTPEYAPVVPMISPLNEPRLSEIGAAPLLGLYVQIYELIRSITGTGQGPFIALSDGVSGLANWNQIGFLGGAADRLAVDAHTYGSIFVVPPVQASFATQVATACASGDVVRQSLAKNGLTITGEVTLATDDCGRYLNGVGNGNRWEGTFETTNRTGSCAESLDHKSYTAQRKAELQVVYKAWADASIAPFYWTWRIGLDASGQHPNPLWDMSLGLSEGWIPTDVRNTTGTCSAYGHPLDPFAGNLTAAQVGGSGAASLPSASRSAYAWPPATMSNATTTYSYTQTAKPITLSAEKGNGWANPSDTALAYTPIATVQYPFAWPTSPPATKTAS